MFDGLLGLGPWELIAATLVLTHITIVSVTVFLHRCQAHRSLAMHPALAHLFRFWLWLATGMVTREWVAVHRKHHARVETGDDPHSPQVRGLRKVLWQGAELYKASAAQPETLAGYGHSTPDDWIERHVYSRWRNTGIALMFLIDLLLFGVAGIAVWAVQMAWIPFFAAGVINGVGHYAGYRNFECADASTNIVPWGILIGGEELHNNHHAFAGSARFSSKWWEFDIGWLYIRMLQWCGLVTVRRVAPALHTDPRAGAVGPETLAAVITSRWHVMARYARDVVARVHREELARPGGRDAPLLRRARRLMVRADARLDEHARARLEAVLRDNARLDVVYQFRQRLQEIWRHRTATQEMLIEALQEWCRQAEETGIQALEDFAASLRGFRLQAAG